MLPLNNYMLWRFWKIQRFIVSSCIPTTEEQVHRVVNMLKDDITPLITPHHSAITNISSVMEAASGGIPTNKVVTDDESNGSTNTGSTTDTFANYAINKLHTTWQDQDFWKAGRGK